MNELLLCLSLLTSPVDTPAALRGCLHVGAVVQAVRDYGGDDKQLLAQGYVESRWVSGLVSSAGCCGPWQVSPRWSGQTCAELDRADEAPRAAARALRYWQQQCSGDSQCVLRGYACGWQGVKGKCGNGYVNKVKAAQRLLFGG